MKFRNWYLGLTVSLVAGALAVAACGGDDNGASPGNDAGNGTDATSGSDGQTSDASSEDAGVDATAEEIAACHAITDAVCSTLAGCDNGEYAIEAACKVQARSCPNSIFGDGSKFTVDQANACAAQIADLGCARLRPIVEGSGATPPLNVIAACNVRGTRGPGDSCEFSSQCASLFCASPEANYQTALNGASARCGACAPTFGPNDDCNPGAPFPSAGGAVCPPGTACDFSGTHRCKPANLGASCVGNACEYPLVCEPNPDGGVGTCVALPASGSPCDPVLPCGSNGYCLYGSAAHDDGGVCQSPLKKGADCTTTVFAGPTCARDTAGCFDLDGGTHNYCVGGAEGEACPCAPGLICDTPIVGQQICVKPQKDGDPCGAVRQKYPDGGTAPSTYNPICKSGNCSATDCVFLEDGGATGVCFGGPSGGDIGESCGTLQCTTCQGGSLCTGGKCAAVDVDCH